MKYEIKEASEFERLSRKLEPDERNTLLQKIQKIKTLDDIKFKDEENPENIVHKQLNYASNIYQKSDFLSKFFVWLESFFTGKKKEEVVVERLLADIKKDLSMNNPDILNFRTNSFSKTFIDQLTLIYKLCDELSSNFNYFFQDPVYYYSFLSHILEEDFDDDLKKSANNLRPETYELKTEHVEKELFFMEKDKRFKNFLQKISVHSFSGVEDFFKKFEYIILLVLFDYNFLLNTFNKPDTSGNNASAEIYFFSIEELLERFYVLIESIDFGYEEIKRVEEMIDFSETFKKDSSTIDILFSATDIENLIRLFDALHNFKESIPLKKIFQYFKKNLMYAARKVDFASDFVSIFKEFKRKLVNKEWSEFYSELGERNLKKTLSHLFKDYEFNSLDNFNPDLKRIVDEKSNLKLKNVKKMNLLVKFFEDKYSKDVERTLNKILINGNFTKDSYRGNLSNIYYLLHNYASKLRIFDVSFDNDEDLGKRISSYTKTVFSEQDKSKAFQNIIKEVNLKSDKICEDAYVSLWNLNIFLNNLTSNLITTNVILLNLDDIRVSGGVELKNAILKIKEMFDLFFKIYNNLND